MTYNGYLVSFMPGSRGRLVANVVYKLCNNLSNHIEFTNLNSAHNFIDNNNVIFLRKKQDQLILSDTVKRVFFTHLSPNETWPDNVGIIFINVSSDKFTETLLNAAIKNIFPKFEKQLGNIALTETESKFLSHYESLYPTLNCDIFSDPNKRLNFLKFVETDGINHKTVYKQFIDNTEYTGFRLEYADFFVKEDGKYITLNKLCTFLNVPYTDSIHEDWELYDKGKYKIFETYYPSILNKEVGDA